VNHTVLVVDDDADIRETLRLALEYEGYSVRTAADGVQAVNAMEAERPCMVILDLMMPVMDGWEVASRMHEEERLSSIPVCVVTATPEWAPADSRLVMQKPIELRRLLTLLEEWCTDPHQP
jgi:two-component system, chemotaxis family, chemotaxis protein CheY